MFHDPYSGHGPYGRHNREHTPEDLAGLLAANGFTVRTMFTADVHRFRSQNILAHAAPLLKNRQMDLGGNTFFAGAALTLNPRRLPQHDRSGYTEAITKTSRQRLSSNQRERNRQELEWSAFFANRFHASHSYKRQPVALKKAVLVIFALVVWDVIRRTDRRRRASRGDGCGRQATSSSPSTTSDYVGDVDG